jgi:hypothetical protein
MTELAPGTVPPIDTARCVQYLQNEPELAQTWLQDGRFNAILEASQQELSVSASDLETGIRWNNEKTDYEDALVNYKTCLAAYALSRTVRLLEDPATDTDTAKRDLFEFLIESKLQVVRSDIHRRLEISRLERAKKYVMTTSHSRFIGGMALGATFGGVAYGASEVIPAGVTHATVQAGSIAAAVGVIIKPQIKAGMRKLGDVFKRRLNSSIDFYNSPELRMIMEEEAAKGDPATVAESLHRRLTEYHMQAGIGKIATLILTTDLADTSRESVAELVTGAVDLMQSSLDDFYGIRPPKPGRFVTTMRRILHRDQPTPNETMIK